MQPETVPRLSQASHSYFLRANAAMMAKGSATTVVLRSGRPTSTRHSARTCCLGESEVAGFGVEVEEFAVLSKGTGGSDYRLIPVESG